jgi:hypothetical protein
MVSDFAFVQRKANAGKHRFTVCHECRRLAGRIPPMAAFSAKTMASLGDVKHFRS